MLTGPVRRPVDSAKSGRTIYFRGRSFQSLRGAGYKANYYDTETGDHYWVSGPKKDGSDRRYGEKVPVEIDEDVREHYWREVRGAPERAGEAVANH